MENQEKWPQKNFLLQTQFLVCLNLYSRAGAVSRTKEPFKAGTPACRSAWILSKLGSTHGENQSVYGCAFTMLQNVCERRGSSSRLLSKSPAPQRCTHKYARDRKKAGRAFAPPRPAMKWALIASKGSSQWGFRAAREAFPARAPFRLASIPPLSEGKGTGLLREARRLISIPLAYSLRCAGRACRGQPRLPANKAPFIPGAGFLPAARTQMGWPRQAIQRPGRAARPGAHRPQFKRPALARATPASISAASARRIHRTPFSFQGVGSADTESFQGGNPEFTHGSLRTKMSVSTALSPAPPPLPFWMVRPKVLRVVRGLCFSSAASEIPTKGSLPDFCVSSIQCLESSYPLVVTKYIIASLQR